MRWPPFHERSHAVRLVCRRASCHGPDLALGVSPPRDSALDAREASARRIPLMGGWIFGLATQSPFPAFRNLISTLACPTRQSRVRLLPSALEAIWSFRAIRVVCFFRLGGFLPQGPRCTHRTPTPTTTRENTTAIHPTLPLSPPLDRPSQASPTPRTWLRRGGDPSTWTADQGRLAAAGRLKEGVGTNGGEKRTVAQEPAAWFLGMTSLCVAFAPLEILGVTFAVNYGRRRGSNVRASHKPSDYAEPGMVALEQVSSGSGSERSDFVIHQIYWGTSTADTPFFSFFSGSTRPPSRLNPQRRDTRMHVRQFGVSPAHRNVTGWCLALCEHRFPFPQWRCDDGRMGGWGEHEGIEAKALTAALVRRRRVLCQSVHLACNPSPEALVGMRGLAKVCMCACHPHGNPLETRQGSAVLLVRGPSIVLANLAARWLAAAAHPPRARWEGVCGSPWEPGAGLESQSQIRVSLRYRYCVSEGPRCKVKGF